MAVIADDGRRHAHFDTMRPADLLAFDRDRHRAAKNNQVVEHPDNTHPDGENFVFRAVHKAPDPHRDADRVEQHEVDIGPGDHPVDILLFHQPTLRGDVEFAFMRVNQRHKGGRRDIPSEHRLVDFTPERMAVFALNLRVGQAGVDHMRQHEQRDHQRRRINDIGMEQQKASGAVRKMRRGIPERKWSMALA